MEDDSIARLAVRVAAASNPAADPSTSASADERGVAVDTMEVIFGNLLLYVAGLAAISLAVMVLLLQANLILLLWERLNRS